MTFGWFPGDAQPSYKLLVVDGEVRDWRLLGNVDCSIDGVWERLRLGEVSFAEYADESWFQRAEPWDLQDRSALIESLQEKA